MILLLTSVLAGNMNQSELEVRFVILPDIKPHASQGVLSDMGHNEENHSLPYSIPHVVHRQYVA